MKLTTRYLGLDLEHPFMAGASPLADDLDAVRRLEDAGAAAIVMRSLFEEQLEAEQLATLGHLDRTSESFAEASSFLPEPEDFALGPEEYLDLLVRIRDAIDLPVIASLNGTASGWWLQHAELIAEAGADAIELNVFDIETDLDQGASDVEQRLLTMVHRLRAQIEIPIAVKLAPFYSALLHLAASLVAEGADGLVIFNRFYESDLDIDQLTVERRLSLSTSAELPLRLRWLAIVSGRVETSLAATGGVHTLDDAIKALMCGAHAVQLVSVLLGEGLDALAAMRRGLEAWLEDHEYHSLDQLRGSMNIARCPDPSIYERANYIHLLHSFRV